MPSFHRWSGDLVALLGITVFATAIVLDRGTVAPSLRLVALPLLTFAPGYALVSLLFPEHPDPDRSGESGAPSVGVLERIALSVAASVGIVPMVALVLNFTAYGVRARPVAIVVAAIVTICSLLALVARLRVDPDRRFGMGVAGWVAEVDSRSFSTGNRSLQDRGLFDAETEGQRLLNVAIVCTVLVFGASVAFAATVPTSPADDATFTEFYLLGENENGTLTARSVPRTFEPDQSRPVHVVVHNEEKRDVEYTTVVSVQRASVDGSDVRVEESREIDRFSTTIPDGETERVTTQINPALSGDRLRVVFLLYRGQPPANPSTENAYRSARVWITVGGNASSGGARVAPSPATGLQGDGTGRSATLRGGTD